ncbi:MAG: hypothetical protein COU90_03625, partial [Candidatus Ryanbacteria bacterium CG10_big_fil_rev_8_21_14_0_10_43_42]
YGTTKYYTASSTASDGLAFHFDDGFVSSASSTIAGQLTVSGNVGIGTTTPWAQLSVEQNGSNTRSFVVGDTGSSSPAFIVKGNGRVGIGIENPLNQLHVYSGASGGSPLAGIPLTLEDDTTAGIQLLVPNTGIEAIRFGDSDDNGVAYIQYLHSTDNLSIRSGGDYIVQTGGANTRLSIGTTGDVGIGTTTPWAQLSVEQNGSNTRSFVVGDTGSSSPAFIVKGNGRSAIGTTSPRGFLAIDGYAGQTASTSYTVRGIDEQFTFNLAGAGTQIGNKLFITNAPTSHSNTLVGQLIKINDSTALGNTVRGLEVQSHLGSNTLGENTAISAFGRTFGVRGVTTGDAGGVFEPAGVIAETRGTTQGNALRAYSNTLTSGTLVSLFQETTDMTGVGLDINLGQNSGSFTGDFFNLKNAGKEVFAINSTGSTSIGTSTTNIWTLTVQGGVCITAGTHCPDTEINGGLRVDTAGVASDDPGDVFDVAERYPASEVLSAGDIAMIDTTTTDRAMVKKAYISSSTTPVLVGIVSSRPALAINGSDITLAPGREATSTTPLIALSGRVSVKVSEDNGAIEKGDRIAASSIPGVGQKANEGDATVGFALESYANAATTTDSHIRKILVFINLGHATLDKVIASGEADAASTTINQLSGAFEPLDGSLDLGGADIVHIRGILSENGTWSIDENGNLKVRTINAERVRTDSLEVGSETKPFGTTLYDTEGGYPYCVYVSGGELKTVSGTCEQNTHLFSGAKETTPPAEENTEDPPPSVETPIETESSPETETPSNTEEPSPEIPPSDSEEPPETPPIEEALPENKETSAPPPAPPEEEPQPKISVPETEPLPEAPPIEEALPENEDKTPPEIETEPTPPVTNETNPEEPPPDTA